MYLNAQSSWMEGRLARRRTLSPGTLTLYLSHVCVALSQRENVTSLHSICITISTRGTLAKDDAEEQNVPDISGSHRGQLLLFLSYFFFYSRTLSLMRLHNFHCFHFYNRISLILSFFILVSTLTFFFGDSFLYWFLFAFQVFRVTDFSHLFLYFFFILCPGKYNKTLYEGVEGEA